jgi:hypothetical protein
MKANGLSVSAMSIDRLNPNSLGLSSVLRNQIKVSNAQIQPVDQSSFK